MVRRRTPRRQPQGTVDLLERLRREFGDQVETITFGCEDADLAKLTDDPVTLGAHRGLLKRHQVAELMRSTDVFLDFSTYQAFGRTALEAMACGSTAVVPRIGGAAEFARDGYNAVVVDTCDETATYEGLAGLAGDRERVRLLQAGAVETASRYSVVRAALSEYVLFDNEYRARFGSSSDIADRSAGLP
jgi:glycosyltransferase involved in cell wall biosynthesis